jgi:hypothetical protein
MSRVTPHAVPTPAISTRIFLSTPLYFAPSCPSHTPSISRPFFVPSRKPELYLGGLTKSHNSVQAVPRNKGNQTAESAVGVSQGMTTHADCLRKGPGLEGKFHLCPSGFMTSRRLDRGASHATGTSLPLPDHFELLVLYTHLKQARRASEQWLGASKRGNVSAVTLVTSHTTLPSVSSFEPKRLSCGTLRKRASRSGSRILFRFMGTGFACQHVCCLFVYNSGATRS